MRARLTASEWADKYFYLAEGSSQISGRWTTQPTQIAVLNMMGNDAIRQINVQKSARWGYTKIVVAAALYLTEHRRRNGMIFQPTADDAKSFVIDEIDSIIPEMPVIQNIFPDWKKESKNNNVKKKSGIGFILDILFASTPRNFRRITKQFGIGDEVDAWIWEAGKEGSPIGLFLKRLLGASYPKAIFGTTPTESGISHIEVLMRDSFVRFKFHIKCPKCGHEQFLYWRSGDEYRMRWDKKIPKSKLTNKSVRYHCEKSNCDHGIQYSELHKLQIEGRWVCIDTGTWTKNGIDFFSITNEKILAPKNVGVYVNALYSLTLTDGWAGLAAEWMDTAGDPGKLKTFINTTLGELWFDAKSKPLDHEILFQRREQYPADVPMQGLYLTMFIDVQGDRFEGGVVAWGQDEESFVVDYFVIYGDMNQKYIWDKLESQIRNSKYSHESGLTLTPRRVGIDAGGHSTVEVNEFTKRFKEHYVIPCHGENRPEMPVVDYAKAKNKHGTRTARIGTDTAKDTIYGRYHIVPQGDHHEPCPGRIHFPIRDWATRKWFKQATAEVRKLKTHKGKAVAFYDNENRRNEVTDVLVGNLAMFRVSTLYMGLNMDTLNKSFQAAISNGAGKAASDKPKKKKRKRTTGGLR